VYVINGVLQNNNPFNITVVDINSRGYSNNGSMVTTSSEFTTSSPITVRGYSNFSISLYDPEKLVITYQIHVDDASK
jgi:hypothetical protein